MKLRNLLQEGTWKSDELKGIFTNIEQLKKETENTKVLSSINILGKALKGAESILTITNHGKLTSTERQNILAAFGAIKELIDKTIPEQQKVLVQKSKALALVHQQYKKLSTISKTAKELSDELFKVKKEPKPKPKKKGIFAKIKDKIS